MTLERWKAACEQLARLAPHDLQRVRERRSPIRNVDQSLAIQKLSVAVSQIAIALQFRELLKTGAKLPQVTSPFRDEAGTRRAGPQDSTPQNLWWRCCPAAGRTNCTC